MKADDKFELVHGSGNIYCDLGMDNPALRQLKALLAGKIHRVLEERKLTMRQAKELTGCPAADFSRIRQAKLERFTVNWLRDVLHRLDEDATV